MACTILPAIAVNAEIIYVPGDQPTIQAAIDAANPGDEIIVAPGTYNEVINFLGKAITLRSSDGPDVTTIDSTGLNDSVVKCISGEGPDTVLEGFTITGGTGTLLPHLPGGYFVGGGMAIAHSSPTIALCTFSANSALSGGGMYITDLANPLVTGCTFVANITDDQGGGMTVHLNSDPVIRACAFIGNTAAYIGGGLFVSANSNALVSGCLVDGNEVLLSGGGIATDCAARVDSCVISNNVSQTGGGILVYQSNPLVVNCVLTGNQAVAGGGGVENSQGAGTFVNCTVTGNSSPDGGGTREGASSSTWTSCVL